MCNCLTNCKSSPFCSDCKFRTSVDMKNLHLNVIAGLLALTGSAVLANNVLIKVLCPKSMTGVTRLTSLF